MAKRTINLDKLDDNKGVTDELLLDAMSAVAIELNRRTFIELERAIDTNHESRKFICQKRRRLLAEIGSMLTQWPGDFVTNCKD